MVFELETEIHGKYLYFIWIGMIGICGCCLERRILYALFLGNYENIYGGKEKIQGFIECAVSSN